ncbi:helix-turn-helix transcriptional regulator [Miltoncostaea marina]|uniref:helix-turn-helix transcriptional regulator n=1 Tax=Miltoncostaea marina TaxID=2843215 RepID=UPI001C3E3C32|nr:helix-turn-helix transcriptional regulator [Miltoncostaea marina]
MVKVRGRTLAALRQRAGLSERAVAPALRPLVTRAKANEGLDAARQHLRRLERGEVTELDQETAEKLAAALGVEVEDLETELLWALASTRGLIDLAGHLLAWSDPAEAQARRAALGMSGWPAAETFVAPFSREILERWIADSLGVPLDLVEHEGSLVIDAAGEKFMALVDLELIMQDAELTKPRVEVALTINEQFRNEGGLVYLAARQYERTRRLDKADHLSAEAADAARRLKVLTGLLEDVVKEFSYPK